MAYAGPPGAPAGPRTGVRASRRLRGQAGAPRAARRGRGDSREVTRGAIWPQRVRPGRSARGVKAGYNVIVSARDLLPSERRRRAGVEDATRRALQWFVVPIWIGAGLADWWCHRRTTIERTAGTTESAIHSAMMAEAGVPAMLGLFCEVNAGVLGLTYATLAVHELTAIWDVAYADGRREVTPTEQHVHGFLERVPLMATLLLTVLHWD